METLREPNLTTREFLKCSSLALVGMFLPRKLAEESRVNPGDVDETDIFLPNDLTIVKKVDKSLLKILEENLKDGSEDIPGLEEDVITDEKKKITLTTKISNFQYPEILFSFSLKDVTRKQGNSKLEYYATALMLNSAGFFIANYHTLKSALEKNSLDFGVLYDPPNKKAGVIKVLSYSKRFDIALGRFPVMGNYKQDPIVISRAEPERFDWVYIIKFNRKDIVKTKLQNQILENCSFLTSRDRRIEELRCNREFNVSVEDLELEADFGRVVDVGVENAEKVNGVYYVEPSIMGGDSGSPVYGLNGELIGICVASSRGKPYSNSNSKDRSITNVLKPRIIRSFLEYSILGCVA